MNKVLLLGRIVKQPELRHTTETAKAYLKFVLAVDRDYVNSKGEKGTDFIQVALWGKKAENLVSYLDKGRLLNVIGKLTTWSSEDEAGNRKYFSEIVGEQINFLDTKKEENKDQVV